MSTMFPRDVGARSGTRVDLGDAGDLGCKNKLLIAETFGVLRILLPSRLFTCVATRGSTRHLPTVPGDGGGGMSIIVNGEKFDDVAQLPDDLRKLAEACENITDDQLLMVVEEVGEQVRIRVIGTRKALGGSSRISSAPTQDGHAN